MIFKTLGEMAHRGIQNESWRTETDMQKIINLERGGCEGQIQWRNVLNELGPNEGIATGQYAWELKTRSVTTSPMGEEDEIRGE